MGHVSCIECRGRLLACGRKYCPILLLNSFKDISIRTEIHGSSPPSVFVGRYGYPKVNIGPLVPPVTGDTSILALPEKWFGKNLDELVRMRSVLIRGMEPIIVKDIWSRRAINYQEIALAENSPDIEMKLERKDSSLSFSDTAPPFGPSGSILKLRIGTSKWHLLLEKVYSDVDLDASSAIMLLYKRGVPVSKISKALSVGALGRGPWRKFVPTRWAITATDDTIGKILVSEIKHFETIDKPRVYHLRYIDNRWVALMFPRNWMYELIEVWYPGSTWNPYGKTPAVIHDWEGYRGRNEYAHIGGCYYAARLAVAEALLRERRQAAVVIMRESHEGYTVPIGVWNVRESVRAMLRQKYIEFELERDAINYSFKLMNLPGERWIANSGVLRQILFQHTLDEYAHNRYNIDHV